MRFKISLIDVFVIFIALVPALYLAFVYRSLPQTVPIHFDSSGKPNDYGSKTVLLFGVAVLIAISYATYLLLKHLPRIDPKKTARLSQPVFQKISIALVIVLSALNIIIIYATVHGSIELSKLLFPILGLLFAYMGNLMHSIKPNYFVGIRIPWTLEDPDNWRVTHQLGGKIWFAGGLVLTICTLLFPPRAAEVIFMVGVGILVLVPVVYSFLYFKKHGTST